MQPCSPRTKLKADFAVGRSRFPSRERKLHIVRDSVTIHVFPGYFFMDAISSGQAVKANLSRRGESLGADLVAGNLYSVGLEAHFSGLKAGLSPGIDSDTLR